MEGGKYFTEGSNNSRRGVNNSRGHSPFQVLDASAIEGFRGLAGESSSIYSCIQIYKARRGVNNSRRGKIIHGGG